MAPKRRRTGPLRTVTDGACPVMFWTCVMTAQPPLLHHPAHVSVRKPRHGWVGSWAAAVGAGVIALGLWAGANRPVGDITPYHGQIDGYAFSPFHQGESPQA